MRAVRALLSELALQAQLDLDDDYVEEVWLKVFQDGGGHVALGKVLSLWCEHQKKPLVLFLDEIDSLIGATLVSVLRQLRSGYAKDLSHFHKVLSSVVYVIYVIIVYMWEIKLW